ncbi:MAG: ScpA family protein [Ornithinimicrobium sp.]
MSNAGSVSESASTESTPGGVLTRRPTAFEVHLDVFSGPFELLLGLIAKHKLDVTEIALAEVTDEFVAHLKAAPDTWDLSQASEFLLIAATLLDVKAARLLPGTNVESDEDLELIEARDLLFARLLQYRAFKEVADNFADHMASQGRVWPRDVGVEDRFARLLPELIMTVSPEQLAAAAGRALTPTPEPQVGLTHLHTPVVSVSEQADLVMHRLEATEQITFADLIADASTRAVVVARFLALLELFRTGSIGLEQSEPLAVLTVRATGQTAGRSAGSAHSEFDEVQENADV